MRIDLSKFAAGAFAAAVLVSAAVTTAAASPSPRVSYLTLSMASAYKPAPPAGATDDYHCSLLNPNVTSNSYVVSSNFVPGDKNSTEVHHAILFLVPPSLAATAEVANNGGKGWTCFGETIFSKENIPVPGVKNSNNMPSWLSAWAPGTGLTATPPGTGVLLPKGSLVVLQIHYNTLAGDVPIKSSLTLGTVPVSSSIKPLGLDLFPAPPDVPCLASWHPASTPLCSRANSLKYLGARFGQSAVNFVNLIEAACGRNPNNPPAGDSTACVWRYWHTATIVAIGAHMHLTGSSFKVVLDPGSARQKVLLNVKNFNFDYQKSYVLKTPVKVGTGDRIQVSCTYNPRVHDVNPQLRLAPRRFVTWGDGSSDEMCLALILTT